MFSSSMRLMGLALALGSLSACQHLTPLPPTTAAPLPTVPAAPPVAESGLMAPMVEKRETLVATGYAVISAQEHPLPAQQRLMAIRASRLDAYRALTEQVYGQYIDASTTVADLVVKSDSLRARVEGVVYGAVLVSITPVGEDTYETTLSLDRSVVQDLRTLYLAQIAQRRR
jgi:outer membrane protein FlgP